MIEDHAGREQIRSTPEVIWTWGLDQDGPNRFLGVQRRDV